MSSIGKEDQIVKKLVQEGKERFSSETYMRVPILDTTWDRKATRERERKKKGRMFETKRAETCSLAVINITS